MLEKDIRRLGEIFGRDEAGQFNVSDKRQNFGVRYSMW
jgi:hypothetical protein